MTENQAAAELLRRQALADAAEARAQLEADRPARAARADAAMVERWRARHEETPRPVRRAAEPPQRPIGPPLPGKLQRTRHGPDGRIQSIETYEGAAARQLMGWEKYVADTVAAAVAAERRAANERLFTACDALGGEIGRDVAGLVQRIAALEARLAEAEERLPPVRPKLVGGSDAAD